MESYKEDVVSRYINDLDANTLYGLAMPHKLLPCGNFEWSTDIHATDDVMQYEDGEHGYVLEVDVGYPTELHKMHSEYPLALEHM